MRPTDEHERFWSKVDASGDCWLWTRWCSDRGYGYYSIAGEGNHAPHRYAYEALVGPVPTGLELDHLCRNPRCCNPDHLEPVTHAENLRRSPIAPATRNARKTTCVNGHPFDTLNTYVTPTGARRYRACARANARRHYDRVLNRILDGRADQDDEEAPIEVAV